MTEWVQAQKRGISLNRRGASGFRVFVGFLLLYQTGICFSSRQLLFGPEGIVPFESFRASFSEHYSIFAFSSSIVGFDIIYFLGMGIILAWTAGYATRFLTPLVWLFVHSLHTRGIGLWDGGDNLIELILFYAIFLDLSSYRLDTRKEPRLNAWLTRLHNYALLAVWLQVSTVYLVAGMTKLQGLYWQNGTALYYVIASRSFGIVKSASVIFDFPLLLAAVTWMTVLFQIAFPFVYFCGRATPRRVVVALAMSFHFATGAMMDLITFAGFMIGTEILLLSNADFEWFKGRLRGVKKTIVFGWRTASRRGLSGGVGTLIFVAMSCGDAAAASLPSKIDPVNGDYAEIRIKNRLDRLVITLEKFATHYGFPAAVYAESGGDPIVEMYWNCVAGDRFRWGSVSKQLTATSIAMLIENQKLAVDQRVADIYHLERPGLVDPKVLEIQIQHLLTHTSGLPAGRTPLDNPLSRGSTTVAEMLRTIKLRRVPGSAFEYSNVGYDVLGGVVHQVSGRDLKTFVAQEFVEPLRLSSLSSATDSQNILPGYLLSPVGLVEYRGGPQGVDISSGAGGFVSRPGDLATWLRAVISGRVVAPNTLERLFSGGVSMDRGGATYAWGWVVEQILPLGHTVRHDGALSPTGHQTFAVYLRDFDIVVVIQAGIDISSFDVSDTAWTILSQSQPVIEEPDAWSKLAFIGLARSLVIYVGALAGFAIVGSLLFGDDITRSKIVRWSWGGCAPLLGFAQFSSALLVAGGLTVVGLVVLARIAQRSGLQKGALREEALGIVSAMAMMLLGVTISFFVATMTA